MTLSPLATAVERRDFADWTATDPYGVLAENTGHVTAVVRIRRADRHLLDAIERRLT